MGLYERYLNGDDGRLVYAEIYALGAAAFKAEYLGDVEAVLKETFKRVAYNLHIIYFELKNVGYVFNTQARYNFEIPLLPPLSNTMALLQDLDNAVKDFGYIPLSLQLFYEYVGSCNLAWDYNTQPNIRWELADPLQINSLNDVLDEVSDEGWKEYLAEIIEDDSSQSPYIQVAADYFHKDNLSGGEGYAIQLTKERAIDSLFLNEAHQTTFINYLRICMENCGFSQITKSHRKTGFQSFYDKVKPQLKAI
jgi:hypothetical protein